MDNGIRILTEDEFNKMSVSIQRRVQMSDVAYYFSDKNMKMAYEPYVLETGSVPKIVKNDGTIHEFNALKMGRKFDVDLQGRVVAVPNYNFELLKKIGIRPVIPLSMIPESIASNTTNHFSYGYYPINIPERLEQDLITDMFLSSSYNNLYSIKLDGKSYHVIEVDTPEYGTKKYINLDEHTQILELDLGVIYYMWVELKRIDWTIDRNLGLAIADFIPMTDIEFNDTFYYKSFKDTKLYKWLNGEFLETIMVNEDEKLIIPKKQTKQKKDIIDFKDTEEYKKIIDSVTFLSYEECFDENKKLDIFKHISPYAQVTDFARLTGVGDNLHNESNANGEYWSKTNFSGDMISLIGLNETKYPVDGREACIRPVISYSLISKYLDKTKIRKYDGYIEFEFGFYPQKAASSDLQAIFIDAVLFSNHSLGVQKTDNTYAINDTNIDDVDEPDELLLRNAFNYKEKKYMNVEANLSSGSCLLSNGEEYHNGTGVCVEVLPVTWVASLKDDMAMPKELLLAGIQFDYEGSTDFDESDIKKFVQNYFLPNIFQTVKVKSNLDVVEVTPKEDFSNFSFTDIDTQKNNRKKELGIDTESIEEFKNKIKNVTEEEAERLGKELFDKLRIYNDENYDEIIKLIMSGANVNFRGNNDKGNFPLIVCAKKNYLNTFMTLVKAGADINMSNSYGTTSVMTAARHGNKEILEILILMGADINAKCADGDTALSSAILHNQRQCFDMLVDAGANINSTNLKGQTIFDYEKGMDVVSNLNSDNVSSKKEMGFDDLLSEAINTLQNITDNKTIQKVKK